ncbi:alpha/beta fold hydrolase [Nocardioides sp. AX2bis]|uniref:alpha/beta fold hydrolase n=1 Tax=Nocardioides sp. AX2bis TaxID=2653157 RepID=UPI0012F0E355|nr:alpha/beta hydrolase [Nocardioides sp. AX2bis]VXC32616.1 Putative non-heme chloroperoxidase [Nocardioides sp. AX2bis]
MPTITSKSGLLSKTELHYDETGQGRPVVLIHGWPLNGDSWAKQVPAFVEAGYRVITYDRRGFGQSEKPGKGYDYDHFADDLAALLDELDLTDVTLVGFSMGGGEIARYISRHGQERLRSVVFAAAVPPYLLKTDDNVDGALGDADVDGMQKAASDDRTGFLDGFTTSFFSVDGEIKVSEQDRQDALAMASQAEDKALVDCIAAFARTDFREDLTKVTVPTLVIHGDGDGTVPFEASGRRTAAAIAGSELHVVAGAPHGFTASHAEEFNSTVLTFLAR